MKKLNILLYCFIVTFTLLPSLGFCAHLQDPANVVSPQIANRLEKLLTDIDTHKGLSINEVILPTTEGKSLDELSQTYIQHIEQSTPSVNNYVLLLIILEDRSAKLYPSKNIEHAFNDKVSNDILENVIINLNEKRYDEMARIGVAGIYHYYEKSQPRLQSHFSKNAIFYLITIIALIGMSIVIIRRK